ncbi:pyridoxal phosphate-dependent aminotransferase [Acetobacteraceae bacterium KSS8]|uniref:Aminotransferase n=1 Tax=Endosaccharibacter trunci TaxID=2812733 RepID=A0ABT1W7U3_9PROT|nr:pyridoxal phosphate-dependent aminotransferase [Acetobacteraceae bacterium KSS8]
MSNALGRALVETLPGSLIRAVADAGIGLPDVIPLWFGEVERDAPVFVREAAKQALDAGDTRYVSNFGLPALREAIAVYQSGFGRAVTADRVMVCSSGVNALLLCCQVLLSPGDRVVLPTPHWPNLSAIPAVCGASVETVALRIVDGEWRLDLDALLAALTPDTRMVVLNAPANPTGFMLTRVEQKAILNHCRRHGIWILADDVYERLVFEGRLAPCFLDIADADDRLVTVNSFSKSWAMTGFRLGWITAPLALMPALGKVCEFNTSCAPGFVQRAGIAALGEGEAFVTEMVGELRACRDLAVSLLGGMAGVTVPRPAGAMYAFFRVDGCMDSVALATDMLRSARVGLAPGRAFGPDGEGCLRLCFAVGQETLREACGRIGAYFASGERS